MAKMTLRGLRKVFNDTEVLRGIDLEISQRELVVFVGPSGCGKSTLLRLIAGLEPITEGEFVLEGTVMNDIAPSRRGISMVFQSYALYPHMDVFENMAFGVKLLGLSRDEVRERVHETAGMLQLTPLLERKPRELSGGQRQRVAIGRALVRKPNLLLMDEPLSNLDAALRSEVRLEIAKLHEQIGGTLIYVTHDQVEAMTLADRIVVMNEGRIEQVGTPRELFERPVNTFVATFIGTPKMALIRAAREGDSFTIPQSGSMDFPGAPESGPEVILGIRADSFDLDESGSGFAAEVVYSEYLGNDAYLYARLGDGTLLSVRIDPARSDYRSGDKVRLLPRREGLHFFDPETGTRLGEAAARQQEVSL